jgi:hypothetical protein
MYNKAKDILSNTLVVDLQISYNIKQADGAAHFYFDIKTRIFGGREYSL